MAQRPFVLLSAAMSADGYLDDATPNRLVLSGEADLDRVDELRATSDAILVGAQTVRSDNPRLLVTSAERRAGRMARGQPASPRKVTITRSGGLDPASRFFTAWPPAAAPAAKEADGADGGSDRPLVYAPPAAASALARRLAGFAEVVPVAVAMAPGTGELDLVEVLADLGRRGIQRLMVEGGARILSQFLAAGLADEFWLAIAPVFVADPRAPRLLAGAHVSGRMTLAGLSQAGDVAVLRYLPGPGEMA